MSRVFTTISSVLISTLGEMIIMKLAGAGVPARAHATHLVVINAVVMITRAKTRPDPTVINCHWALTVQNWFIKLSRPALSGLLEQRRHLSNWTHNPVNICREITKIITSGRDWCRRSVWDWEIFLQSESRSRHLPQAQPWSCRSMSRCMPCKQNQPLITLYWQGY